ncbi:MAG: hypothetical protein J6A53_02615 [Clostridia bacterium]|nr:hypothetical protein [Clostridia bacterium]
MSSVNYNSSHNGVRLLTSKEAWVKTKKGKFKLNPNYKFIGKVTTTFPSVIITASDNVQPTFKGDINSLNKTAKNQMVKHFFGPKGKRNKNKVAFFAIKK